MTRQRDDDVLRALLGPEGPELSCEECFEQLDRYVELELAGSDADADVFSATRSSGKLALRCRAGSAANRS